MFLAPIFHIPTLLLTLAAKTFYLLKEKTKFLHTLGNLIVNSSSLKPPSSSSHNIINLTSTILTESIKLVISEQMVHKNKFGSIPKTKRET